MNRRQRRAARSRRPDLATLQRDLAAMVAASNYAPLTIHDGRTLILVTQGRPPLCCAWPETGIVWRRAGVVLDPDTTAEIDALLASGKIPGLFVLGEHAHVRAIDVRPLDRCGGIA